jgi:hypothetical protein
MVKSFVVAACALALVVGCNAVAGIEPATLDDTSGELGADPTDPTAAPTDGACAVSSTLCNNRCVAQDDPSFGCGSATCSPCNVRHATAACKAGACVVAQCAPGFADCNGDPSDGCEADLSNAATCGACNVACSGASSVCARGGGCTSGCPSSMPTQCGSTCTDLRNDPNRCGSCDNACPAPTNGTATCSGGRCGVACGKGSHMCSGACVSSSSVATCGPSCSPCPAAANATPTCNGVGCGFVCSTGFANCDKVDANGCETSLLTDPANCGVCGHACAAPTLACVNGACQ